MGRSTLTLRHSARVGLLALAGALASSNGSQASPIIERGWDLFETASGPAPGTVFDFDDAGPMAPIPFTGVPLGSFDFATGTDGDFGRGIGVRGTGTADTIIKRLDIAEPGIDKTEPPGPIIPEAGRIDLEMVALQLMSVDLVDIDPGPAVDEHFFFVTLQSERDPALTSTGEMTIDGLTSEGDPHGSFFSELIVLFDLRIDALTGPVIFSGTQLLEASGVPWSHFPPPGALEIRGVNTFLNGVDKTTDFWPVSSFAECEPDVPNNCHVVASAQEVPEPGTLLLLGAGLVGVMMMHGRRRLAKRS